jgi:ribosomal protein S12 methylthiotransferase
MRGGSAYVKVAEGCDRSCGFCVIPQLRGKQRSRTKDDIVREVEQLAASGVLEVSLVSQDTVAFGRDRKDETCSLADVAESVADVPGIRWVRLHYLYPEKLDPRLIELLADHPRVLPYVDMPLQHAAESMLRRMRRGHGGARLRGLVEQLRAAIPGLVFRSAFIVGHPGETEEEFEELLQFVRWAELDRVGVFRYSDEVGTPSYELGHKVPARVAKTRAHQLSEVQRRISKRKNRNLVGSRLEILIEGPSEESELVMVGRHAGQAPAVDGCVFVSGGPVSPGQMHVGTVTQASDYDLVVEVDDRDGASATSRCPPSPVVRTKTGRVTLRTVG